MRSRQLLVLIVFVNCIALINILLSDLPTSQAPQLRRPKDVSILGFSANVVEPGQLSGSKEDGPLVQHEVEESPAGLYIKARLQECTRTTVIEPSDEVGLGLLFSQVLLLINNALSQCKIPLLPKDGDLLWFRREANINAEDMFRLERSDANIQSKQCGTSCQQRDALSAIWIPEEFKLNGLQWWYGELARYFIRPAPGVLDELHNADVLKLSPLRRAHRGNTLAGLFDLTGLKRPIVALHLRKGDSCIATRPACLKASSVVDVFNLMAENGLAGGTILLASDSDVLVESTKELAPNFGFDVHALSVDRQFYTELERKKNVAIEDHPDLKKHLKERNLLVESLLDLALLSQGDIHVGSFYSNFIRIAMSLSSSNEHGKYISLDSRWCPFDSCSFGWMNPITTARWHKHLCQWRPRGHCDPKYNVHCGQVGSAGCGQDCFVFHASMVSFESFTPYKFLSNNDLCCSEECQESSQKAARKGLYSPHHDTIMRLTEMIAETFASGKVARTESSCNPVDMEKQKGVESAIERGKRNVLSQPIGHEVEVPSSSCAVPNEPDWKALRNQVKKSNNVIVYMAQKKHASYGHDSFKKLQKSLDLLYENYNNKHKSDVLVFHDGDFTTSDLEILRKGGRKELHLIKLEGKFWELPGFMTESDQSRWTDNQFSVGYRHMCRWYSGLLFEFVHHLGYQYVMRMDEDSYLHSKIQYDLFQFMRENEVEYGYRVDAFEPCCHQRFRQDVIDTFISSLDDNLEGYYNKCCRDGSGKYNNYGYYNNFFISKVSFWMQPKVRRLFYFLDWTGGFYLFRENDLFVQSFSVQLFMPESKVHKFTDWSYEHVTERARCEWGAVVKGYNDHSTGDYLDHFRKLPNVMKVKNPVDGSLQAVYCTETNYKANVELNYHTQQLPDSPDLEKSTAAADLLRRLEHIASDCMTDDEAESSLWLEAPECGGGCTINFMVKPLLYAIQHNLKVVTPRSRWLHGKRNCTSNDVSCFIRRLADAKTCKGRPKEKRTEAGIWRRISQDDEDFFQSQSGKLPLEFQEYNMYWVVGQVVDFILQPSQGVRELVNRIVANQGLDKPNNQPVLGLHVRMGDACSDPQKADKGRTCDGLDRYLPYVKELVQRYGYKSVYIATDSSAALFNATTKQSSLPWLYDPFVDRKKYDAFMDKEEMSIEGVLFGHSKLKAAGFVAYDEMLHFLADTIILGRYTQGFIGKFTSNLDRLVVGLQSAKYGSDVPAVSLDSHWCADFMVRSGHSYDGRSFYC